ncbi:MAG: hypothetical protein HOI56_03900 [Gammaproteobacteria bacterium]|nr:hypothetical protein [Gammaproteobacteria bacterium]MBT4462739.1 hypothetical protein [Gammaproteobacteria bacterium]MBT4654385.1 hypothetical protein [Gammaproteobacteria bacterium]MBT5117294.1 hypothetical protein [Gammaproteobacteria bacterium]MBT5761866.1 hypothetical protein [Gammaproteobacteria bacterium]
MKNIFSISLFLIISIGIYNYSIFFGTNPIKHVYKEGTFTYSNETNVDNILKSYISHELYEINLREIKNLIEEDIWIKNAQIILDPPDIIIAKISEFKPLYLWNNSFYVDDKGVSISPTEFPIKNILKITSNNDTQEAMYNLYLSVQRLFSVINIDVIELSKNNDMMVILTPQYRFSVRHNNFDLKLNEFISVYDQFILTQDPIKIRKNIDLRYPTGFAVQ